MLSMGKGTELGTPASCLSEQPVQLWGILLDFSIVFIELLLKYVFLLSAYHAEFGSKNSPLV